MESIEDIYYNLKKDPNLPIAVLAYITYDGKEYDYSKVLMVDFKKDEDSINKMKSLSQENNFYAFLRSEKGKELLGINDRIHQSETWH